jgi:hypothetical protein
MVAEVDTAEEGVTFARFGEGGGGLGGVCSSGQSHSGGGFRSGSIAGLDFKILQRLLKIESGDHTITTVIGNKIQ